MPGVEERLALQQLCREQMKLRLLVDIQQDVMVCGLEGWDYREFLRDLVRMIERWL